MPPGTGPGWVMAVILLGIHLQSNPNSLQAAVRPSIGILVAMPAILDKTAIRRANGRWQPARCPTSKALFCGMALASGQSPGNGPRFGECLLRVQGDNFILARFLAGFQESPPNRAGRTYQPRFGIAGSFLPEESTRHNHRLGEAQCPKRPWPSMPKRGGESRGRKSPAATQRNGNGCTRLGSPGPFRICTARTNHVLGSEGTVGEDQATARFSQPASRKLSNQESPSPPIL